MAKAATKSSAATARPRQPRAPALATTASSTALPGPVWPPYGYMPLPLETEAQSGTLPFNFTEASWAAFAQRVRDAIADVLWPYHDGAGWVGRATAGMSPLTSADLDLLDTVLRPLLAGPAGSTGDLAQVTHKTLFVAEDDMPVSGGLFETLRRYLATQPPSLVSGAIAAAGVGIRRGMGSRPLLFKRMLQRPRPYQASFLLARAYTHEPAKSAFTPSMMSGHCLQGLFAATWAYVDQRQQFDTLPGARGALAQFGVDFGDRRVFAGVHYPSDNLASWYIALQLAAVCFGPAGATAKLFMADAIRGSRVYRALTVAAGASPASPFVPVLRWIDSEL